MSAADAYQPSPPLWARFVVFIAWVVTAIMVFCCALLGPALVGVVPIVFLAGVGLISSAHSLLDR
jgi:hypothetical protein